MKINDISGAVIEAAMKVHTLLGPGLLEHTYLQCLAHELRKRGLDARTEVYLPVLYEGTLIDIGYRLDLLVETEVIVEAKSTCAIAPIHKAQLLTYLRLSNKKVGLLINFNVEHLRDGLTRMIL
jgi:GxxExxY protein